MKIQTDEAIVINAFNSEAGNILTINIKTATDDERMILTQAQMTPSADRTKNTKIINLPTGDLISLTISTSTSGFERGKCYVNAYIAKTGPAGSIKLYQLIADYVTDLNALTFPGAEKRDSLAPPGYPAVDCTPNTENANEATWLIPPHNVWKVISMYTEFITDATVANRYVYTYINDGANYIWKSAGTPSLTASSTNRLSAAQSATRVASVNFTQQFPIGNIAPEFTVGFLSYNTQVGDTFQNSCIYYESLIGG